MCVPLHLLLPFVVAMAHQHGWLLWFKRDWVTFAWWRALLFGKPAEAAVEAPPPAAGACCTVNGCTGGDSKVGAAIAETNGTAGADGAATKATVGVSSEGLARRKAGPA